MFGIGGPRQHGSFLLSFYLLRNSKTLMTRTYSLQVARNATIAFIFVIMAFLAFTLTASAESGTFSGVHSENSGSGGGAGMSSGFANSGKSVMSLEQRLAQLKGKIDELGKKKDELMTLLGTMKNGQASSTSNSHGGNWKDRFCATGTGMGNISIPTDVRERICNKDNHGTSTDERGGGREKEKCIPTQASSTSNSGRHILCERKNASTTPMIKVVRPNGGTVFTRPNDKSVLIHWRSTVKGNVDIDLKTGSTTTSIAKDVKGNMKKGVSGSVLGASSSVDAGSREGKSSSTSGRNLMGERDGKASEKVLSYRWKNAPVGEGYKIIVTVKKDGKTYTDESDSAFAVKAAPHGLNFGKHEKEIDEDGDVLGAQTTSLEELNATFENILAELAFGLSR